MDKAQRSSRTLVTLTIGDFDTKMGAITHPLMKADADCCDVDFVVIGDAE